MSILVVGLKRSVVDTVVAAIIAEGATAQGVTSEDAATARLAEGGVSTLVIGGGVDAGARRRLRIAAVAADAGVIDGALGDRAVEQYVREEILPGVPGGIRGGSI